MPNAFSTQHEQANTGVVLVNQSSVFSWQVLLFCAGLVTLIVSSFLSLDLQIAELFNAQSLQKMTEFVVAFFSPDLSASMLQKIWRGAWQTLAMSALGTILAAIIAIGLALTAKHTARSSGAVPLPTLPLMIVLRWLSQGLLNIMRSIPELFWAALLLIAVGLGPLPGTLALALHTTGVLGRLFAQALENCPQEAASSLQLNGASALQQFLYATLPNVLPQWISYTLYRWENNIRAATVLGVVGAGGLGQMLYFHLSLFQMEQVATVIGTMIVLVLIVDATSAWMRRQLA